MTGVRVEDGGVTRTVHSPILRDILRYLLEYEERLRLDEYAGELLITWSAHAVTARPRPVLPTRKRPAG